MTLEPGPRTVDVETVIRTTLAEDGHVELVDVGPDDDLYAHGLTSHGSVDVMLALEDRFGVEFPEKLLRRQTFESIGAIGAALLSLGVQ